ncbi:MAG: hypothetical protein ACOYXT_14855 [Bacteroidota bacterium]
MKHVLPKFRLLVWLQLLSVCACANVIDTTAHENANRQAMLLREAPGMTHVNIFDDSSQNAFFKPSFNVGTIVHMFFSSQQNGYGSPSAINPSKVNSSLMLYRARILLGGQLSKKGSFFLETDIGSPIGIRLSDSTKNIKVSPILLDVQYEHKIAGSHMIVAGMQLVSHNRNGLQGAAALMANDFTYFQYPYNLFEDSPLQGNFGRDVGINLRGFFLKNKLEYRLGMFSGRRFTNGSPFRYVGRVVYNFLDPEKDYYYAGTKLGLGKTIALGAGFDTQTTYNNIGADLFIDLPAGTTGSVTLNAAYSKMTGGNNPAAKYSFATMIPKQSTQFLELGYYFKGSKLQPWLRYEKQDFASQTNQVNGDTKTFDDLNSSTVLGGGLNYFFNGYGTNLRMSYTTWTQKNIVKEENSYGQFWLQLQFFLF